MTKKIDELLNRDEGKTIEFKRDVTSLNGILKTIIAFANTAGGILVIGVDDSKNIIGIQDPQKEQDRLANAISDNIYPLLFPEFDFTTVDGKTLLMIEVSHSIGPYYLKQKGEDEGTYVRLGATSRTASIEIISEIRRTRTNTFFDRQPCNEVTHESLDPQLLDDFFNQTKHKHDHNKMLSLGVLVKRGNVLVPSNGGIIVFGKTEFKQEFFPNARISCARFRGKDKSEFLDKIDIESNLINAPKEILNFIRRNTRVASKIETLQREDIYEYDEIALREALINALVHANYEIAGSRITIGIFDNRLEIQNPGILPLGMTLNDLKSGITRIRNWVITRLFREINLIEEWGSGYGRIVSSIKKGGYPMPILEELGSAFRVTLFSHPFFTEMSSETKKGPSWSQAETKLEPGRDQVIDRLSEEAQKILEFCQTPKSIVEIMKFLNFKNRTNFRQNYLKVLLKKGLIRMTIPEKPQSSKQKYVSIIQRDLESVNI